MKTGKLLTVASLTVFFFFQASAAQAGLFGRTTVHSVVGPEVALFSGAELTGWTNVAGGPEMDAWEVIDGVLHCHAGGGDIVTKKEYRNFILDFDWKISVGGNSGLKYRFRDFDGRRIGCEYQILDDLGNKEGASKTHGAGDLYDMFSASETKLLKPVGEFNHSRIIVDGNRVEHWLNGERILSVQMGSPSWQKALAKSKFNETLSFGRFPGKILLQDHGDEVWFKEIKIQEIKKVQVMEPRRRFLR